MEPFLVQEILCLCSAHSQREELWEGKFALTSSEIRGFVIQTPPLGSCPRPSPVLWGLHYLRTSAVNLPSWPRAKTSPHSMTLKDQLSLCLIWLHPSFLQEQRRDPPSHQSLLGSVKVSEKLQMSKSGRSQLIQRRWGLTWDSAEAFVAGLPHLQPTGHSNKRSIPLKRSQLHLGQRWRTTERRRLFPAPVLQLRWSPEVTLEGSRMETMKFLKRWRLIHRQAFLPFIPPPLKLNLSTLKSNRCLTRNPEIWK